jgi:PhzF family phenazine biosynthesis protein
MKVRMFQVDSFTDRLFGGNPAAVCILENWLPETAMQQIAMENNLAETAFILTTENGYEIRWFTPKIEVNLCGHATLAAAHVLFNHMGYTEPEINFLSMSSGTLSVKTDGNLLTLDFPADVAKKIATPPVLLKALGIEPMETWQGKTDIMAVLPSEEDVIKLRPDFELLGSMDVRGIIVTAEGTTTDFVSRFFAPQSGINEDPVTGSAHTTLTPYWAKELGKDKLSALQLSERRGNLWCTNMGARVAISGHAVTYMEAEIAVPAVSNQYAGGWM